MLTFCIEFLPLLLWLPLRVRGPQENHEDYAQFRFCRIFLFLGGEKAGGLSGGCEKLMLPVEVVPVKGGVVLGCFVETLTLKERQVAGGDFRCNLVKNWSGENMCLVGIRVDRSLGVSVFSIGCSRRRYLVHEIPRTLRYHRRQLQVGRVEDFGQYTACL